jgi:uncharacterized RDD family membrane protein YckC
VQYAGAAPIARGLRYGGFWIRFVAAIIDGIIVQAVVLPLSFLVGGVTGMAGAMSGVQNTGLQIMGGAFGFVIGVAGSWLYEALMESSVRQATLGKMIFQMKVTDLSGNRITFARATGRYFAKWLSGLTLFIGYIIAGFTERKQALHDMVAGTWCGSSSPTRCKRRSKPRIHCALIPVLYSLSFPRRKVVYVLTQSRSFPVPPVRCAPQPRSKEARGCEIYNGCPLER